MDCDMEHCLGKTTHFFRVQMKESEMLFLQNCPGLGKASQLLSKHKVFMVLYLWAWQELWSLHGCHSSPATVTWVHRGEDNLPISAISF